MMQLVHKLAFTGTRIIIDKIGAPDGVAFRGAGYAYLWRPDKNLSFSILGGFSF